MDQHTETMIRVNSQLVADQANRGEVGPSEVEAQNRAARLIGYKISKMSDGAYALMCTST